MAKTSKQLAAQMAKLAKVIRTRVNAALSIEAENGPLRRVYRAFRETLVHDLSEDAFANMYAQTMAYGLFAAARSRPFGVSAETARDMVPNTNPFLRELLAEFTDVGGSTKSLDFDELGIDALVGVLNQTNMKAVLEDFDDKNPNEDPVIHFYEDFLREYDKEMKIQRGVFFTPRPVVSFIVRSVDQLLRTEFGLEDGLADVTTWGEMRERHPELQLPSGATPDTVFVQILDPAVGTGTFLVEVIAVIYATMLAKWAAEGVRPMDTHLMWNEYVTHHLLPRIYGFELMMASYTIAHMKIGLKLSETGYKFDGNERLRIYLTNTLEEPRDVTQQFEGFAPALAHEATGANEVKRNAPITIVMGNPPYSNYSANLSTECRALVDRYRTFHGQPIRERNQLQFERNIQDDYVKFIARAEELIERQGTGVASMITNSTVLRSRSLRGLRAHILQNADSLFVCDLHGGANERVVRPDDANVFDIEQGVAVHVYARTPHRREQRVLIGQLIGSQSLKLQTLNESTVYSDEVLGTEITPDEANCTFGVTDQQNMPMWSLGDVFVRYGAGIKTNQDSVAISFTREQLLEQMRAHFDRHDVDETFTRRIMYRPFDWRWIYYDRAVVASRSLPTMQHMLIGANIGLLASSSWTTPELFTVSVSRDVVEMKSGTHDRGTSFFPAFRYEAALGEQPVRSSNIAPEFVNAWTRAVGRQFELNSGGDSGRTTDPTDIVHWIVACTFSSSYRHRFKARLSTGFPLIPLTSNDTLVTRLSQLGADLTALLLLDGAYSRASWNLEGTENPFTSSVDIRFVGSSRVVGRGWPRYLPESRVAVNPADYFQDIPATVWQFRLSGYQVCEKWLKDRRGRTLSDEDINHYGRIVVALREIIRLMGEIDAAIEEQGGWPAAFESAEVGP